MAQHTHPARTSGLHAGMAGGDITLSVGRFNLHPARVIYGTIVVVAILPPLARDARIAPGDALSIVVGTALVLWLAHCFAEMVAARYRTRRALNVGEIAGIAVHELSVVSVAILPIAMLAISWAGWIETQTALRMAAWGGIGVLFFAGWAVGAAGGLRWLQSLVAAMLYGGLGTFIVVLELALSH